MRGVSRIFRIAGARLRRRDDGFTLIELMVAAGVMATALAMMAGVLTSSMTATGYARERQSATGLANQVLEQLRALPMATLAGGMGSNDLASTTDTAITKGVGANCQNANSGYTYGGETIRCTYYDPTSGDVATAPLIPHIQNNVTVGPTTYKVSTYLTYYNNNLTAGTYRATASVTWSSALAGRRTRSVQVQTIMYAPNIAGLGCNDPTHHHIPGPCQAGFTADAVQTPATINMTGTVGAMTLDHLTMTSGRVTSDLGAEQTTTVKTTSQASGGEVQMSGGQVQSAGSTLAAATADNDPEGTNNAYQTTSLPAPAAGAQSASDANGNTLNLNVGAGDTGTATSATTANTASAACPNLTTYPSPYTGNENDNLPCGGSTQKTAATGTAQGTLQTIGTVPLAAVIGGGTYTSTAITDMNTAPAIGRCAGTSGDGCSRAQLTRSAAELDAGGLPSNLNASVKPTGFGTYFVQSSAFADSVSAEAGVGTAAPSATQSAGTIKVWCGTAIVGDVLCPVTGYVTKTIAQITQAMTTPTLVLTDASLGGGTTISLSATIKPGSTATTSSCSGTCTRTTATATSTPPTVTMNETITVAGHTVLNTSVVLDPGAANASASYASAST